MVGCDALPGEESVLIDTSTGDDVESSIIITECRLLAPAPTKSIPYGSSAPTPPPQNLMLSEGAIAGNVTRALEGLLDGRLCTERMVCNGVAGGDGEAGGEWEGRCARPVVGECGVGGSATRCC